MKTITIEYNWKRGGFNFVTKEHGDCLYFDTLDEAVQGARESWGEDAYIKVERSATRADLAQSRALQVAS